MNSETIVAVFDTPAHAQLAVADLEAAGIPSSAIQHYAQDTYDPAQSPAGATAPSTYSTGTSSSGASDTSLSGTGTQNTGFWAWLMGDETSGHHEIYNRSLQSGSTVVTVISNSGDNDRIISILEQHSPVDLEERGSQYGLTSAATTGTAQGTSSTYGTAATAATAASGKGVGEEVISLAEETLKVGKRAIERGTTRVRRYVVARPREEMVRLRDETESLIRRPATGAAVAHDAFTDKTISVTETGEEAVVAKNAQVVEEVVVQKQVNERDQKVSDTVRREEVEITGPGGTKTDTATGRSGTVG